MREREREKERESESFLVIDVTQKNYTSTGEMQDGRSLNWVSIKYLLVIIFIAKMYLAYVHVQINIKSIASIPNDTI